MRPTLAKRVCSAVILTFCILGTQSNAHAGNKIEKISIIEDVIYIYGESKWDWKNGPKCQDHSAVILRNDASYSKEIYALLLVAFSNGMSVDIKAKGCIKSIWDDTMPSVVQISVPG